MWLYIIWRELHIHVHMQSPSRQKSQGFVLLVYWHLAEVFCYTWISVKVDSHSGIAKVPFMMYINLENKAMGLLAWWTLYASVKPLKHWVKTTKWFLWQSTILKPFLIQTIDQSREQSKNSPLPYTVVTQRALVWFLDCEVIIWHLYKVLYGTIQPSYISLVIDL